VTALDAATGETVHDPAGLLRLRPELTELMPSEARLWSFDGGPVVTLADARVVRLRGRDLRIQDYAPQAPVQAPIPMNSNGAPRVVPLRLATPIVRHVVVSDAQWLALYTDAEVADALNDTFGDHALYPFTIDDEGPMARRSFRRIHLAPAQRFDESFLQLAEQFPVPGSPVLLRGRFVRDPATDAAVRLDNDDLLVWHRTRIDDRGQLALTRFDPDLATRWQVELPLADGGADLPVATWHLGGQLVVYGVAQSFQDEVRSRVPHLVGVSLKDGRIAAWNLVAGSAADP